ncbi:DUF7344 domain-containing protein [Halomicrococcus sp. NG-SE-24]|uniref:DUF7344 domain-containing protein n=1 Tax=Halomicrococcus sp. NG-SE-24 TaxID=3436928 RepID=UPI003D99A84D
MTSDSKTIDGLFGLFSDERRRHLCLHVVKTEKTAFSLEELVDQVTKRESKAGEGSGERRTRIRAELHHAHLPKMEDVGLVEYDGAGTVRCADCAIASLCEAFDPDEAIPELRAASSN